MIVELGYMNLLLDQSKKVWGADSNLGMRGLSKTDAIKASVTFMYKF